MKPVVLIVGALVASLAPALAGQADRASDEAAIRRAVESYVAGFNRGDAKAVAASWADDGEYLSPDGERLKGRETIEKAFKSLFAERKGARVEVLEPTIRFVSPDVAVEEGTARVVRPGAPADETSYLAIHVKRGGQWKLNTVRETDLPAPPASQSYQHLKDLEWMVGDWIDESKDSTVETVCQWAKGRSFLLRTFRVSAPGMDDLEGTQVVGWDPVAKVIRSWVFDSDGGYLEGTWTRKGNTWIVKAAGYLADGRKASSVNVFTYVDPDTFTWRSFGREVAGHFMPDIPEVKVVRKQPAK